MKQDPLLLARTYLGILRRSLEHAHGHVTVTVLDRLIAAVSVATSPSRHERSAYRLFASALPLALRWCLAGEVVRAVVGEEEVARGVVGGEEEDSSEREREIGEREREDPSEGERESERRREVEHGEGSERERERENERERQREREHGAGAEVHEDVHVDVHAEIHEDGREGGGGSLCEEEVESAAALRKALAERGQERVLEELVGKSSDCDLALTVAASLGVGPVYKSPIIRQKRPIIEAKETYYRGKRDLL